MRVEISDLQDVAKRYSILNKSPFELNGLDTSGPRFVDFNLDINVEKANFVLIAKRFNRV